MMLKKLLIALLFSAAPGLAGAQQVELRSADEFVSLSGEITGFDGDMVMIMTGLGPISIPAAEVICYGKACADLVRDNRFGLTDAAFADVVPYSRVPALVDDLTVGITAPADLALYRSLDAAVTGDPATMPSVALDNADALTVTDPSGAQTAVLRPAATGEAGDITLATTALTGRAAQAYADPAGWLDSAPDQQMLALRAFAVVAADDIGVDTVTLAQLAQIYAGEITNWSQIGGADLPVLPLQLPPGSPLRDDVITTVMNPAGKTIAEDVLTVADQPLMASAVSGLPGSISLIDSNHVGQANVLPVDRSCGFAVSPSAFNILAGDYPLLRPVMAQVATPPASPVLTDLFDRAATSAAQAALAGDGLFDLTPRYQGPVDRNRRLTAVLLAELDPIERPVAAQMFQILFEAERLSPTLIGGATSSAEGAWNRAMMLSLSDWLLRPENAGREVIFAGFADSDAGPQAAIDASLRAAEAVAAAFGDLPGGSDRVISSAGFGAVSPATCYDSQVAASAHSRVEVWIK